MAGGELGIPGISSAEHIGSGAFADVYRARQDRFDREVAVKILRITDLDDVTKSRFDRECRTMGSLSEHPGIVTLHDAGFTDRGMPYLVMAFRRGGTLAEELKRGPLAPARVAEVGAVVADALATAHAAGIVHRDVKPANILLDAGGRPAVGDFGIASVAESSAIASATSLTATPAFAAPELLSGERASPASDIYALGASLYSLAAGKPAYVRPDDTLVALLARIGREDPEPLEHLGVPAELAGLVRWAMQRDPASRPSARALADALDQARHRLAGLPSIAPVGPMPNAGDSTVSGFPDNTVGPIAASALQSPAPGMQSPAPGTQHPTPSGPPMVPPPPVMASPPMTGGPPPGGPAKKGGNRTLFIVAGVAAVVALIAGAALLLGGGGGGGGDDDGGDDGGDEAVATGTGDFDFDFDDDGFATFPVTLSEPSDGAEWVVMASVNPENDLDAVAGFALSDPETSDETSDINDTILERNDTDYLDDDDLARASDWAVLEVDEGVSGDDEFIFLVVPAATTVEVLVTGYDGEAGSGSVEIFAFSEFLLSDYDEMVENLCEFNDEFGRMAPSEVCDPDETTDDLTTDDFSDDTSELYAHIPTAIQPACSYDEDLFFDITLASDAYSCSLGGAGEPVFVDYVEFFSVEDAKAYYDGEVAAAGATPDGCFATLPAECAYDGPDGVGRLLDHMIEDTSVCRTWLDEIHPIVGFACVAPGSPDFSSAETWWGNAGPV